MSKPTYPFVDPQSAYRWNRAHRGAFRKGVLAFEAGAEITDNPYIDHRKPSGMLTWSRSFITAWTDGWRWAKNGRHLPEERK